MGRVIHYADVTDWRRVKDIRLQSLLEAPTAYGSSYEREVGFTDLDWQERLTTARTYLAIDEDGDTVGTATALWTRDGDMHLVGMYVAPAARGTGCAAELIDAVVATAIERGARRTVLQAAAGNEAAVRCYTRYGFAPTGRRVTRQERPELTEVEYALPLEQPGHVSLPG
jgi:ribosomal protein S18 acetylase RimI-like enzyme